LNSYLNFNLNLKIDLIICLRIADRTSFAGLQENYEKVAPINKRQLSSKSDKSTETSSEHLLSNHAYFRTDCPDVTALCVKQMNNHSAAENIHEQLFCQQKMECNLCTK
jgi:hypothetical protein